MSLVTAIPPVVDGSELTTGFFNTRFATINQNFSTVSSGAALSLSSNVTIGGFLQLQSGLAVGSYPPSTTTGAGIFINQHSDQSHGIVFSDSAALRSSYALGIGIGGTADGLNLWDLSGDTMIASFSKQSIRFFQNVVGPVFDTGGQFTDTLNAATFGTGSMSTESRIQAAVDAAVLQSVSRVYVPASMYPFSGASVTFSSAVQMVREGGDWSVYDVQAYGLNLDGTTDNATALHNLANAAIPNPAGGTIFLSGPGSYKLNSTVTLGTIIALKPAQGATFNVASSFTLHVGGPVDATEYQSIFTGLGSVTLGTAATPRVSVRWFGSIADGASSDDTAFKKAKIALGINPGTVYAPKGTYRITSALTFDQDRQGLEGDNVYVTNLDYVPAVEGAAMINFKKANGSIMAQPTLRRVRLVSSNTTMKKIGVRIIDASTLDIADFLIGPSGSWSGNTSVGLLLAGRETSSIGRIEISANQPISIISNPHQAVPFDHFHFHDCYLIASGRNPVVSIGTDCAVQNLIFGGRQAWVAGGYGLYWVDDAASVSLNVNLQNVRWEQNSGDSAGYASYISLAGAVFGLTLDNWYTGSSLENRGYFFRKCHNVALRGVRYAGLLEAVSMDSSCDNITFENCVWQSTSSATMGSLVTVQSSQYNDGTPLPFTAIYRAPGTNFLNQASRLTVTDGASLATATMVGSLQFSPAASRIIPGATHLAVRNNANSVDNFTVFDNGDAVLQSGMTIGADGSGNLVVLGNVVSHVGGASAVVVRDTSAAADAKNWYHQNLAGLYRMLAVDDALGSVAPAYTISRNGFSVRTMDVSAEMWLNSGLSMLASLATFSRISSSLSLVANNVWTSGLSVGNATAGGTLIPAISSTSSRVAAFVVQGSSSSFTRIVWAAAQPGDQILVTVQPDAAVSSMSSGLIAHSHCTQAGQVEFRLSNVSTLAQNQSAKTWHFTRLSPF